MRQASFPFLQSGCDVKLRASCDWESYLGEIAGSSLCSLRISMATMHHTKTAETAIVTWTHFYCNSSIESKKVLININTMPMFRSPPRTVPTPFFPPQEKKREGKTWKKQQLKSSYLQEEDFPFSTAAFSHLFLLFLCTGHVSLENNAHRKDTNLQLDFLFSETLSCKANH